jgi:hypothetical protein
MTIKWSDELVKDICDHLSTGKSIIDVGNLPGYPSSDSIYRQMHRDPVFASAIACAREAGQDHEADECVRMADQATAENWQIVKLRIWARQWRAAKLAPKKFGEKIDINHSGEVVNRHDLSALNDDEIGTLEALVRASAAASGDRGGVGETSPDQVH